MLLLFLLLVRAYRVDGRIETVATGVAIIAAAAFYTAFTRTMIVYKPIMVLHMALTLYSWYGVFVYLLKRRLEPVALLSPLGSIALFFLLAWYFKES